MIFISEGEIEALLSLSATISAMENGFREYDAKDWEIPLRSSIPFLQLEISLLTMPVLSKVRNRIYTKLVLSQTNSQKTGRTRATALSAMWDAVTGEPLMMIDATYATALRTAATAAAASRHLARADSEVIGLIGAGYQGGYLLKAMQSVMNPRRALIFDIFPQRAYRLIQNLDKQLSFPLEIAPSSQALVMASDVILTATDSLSPVFDGGDVRPGTHIISIGSYRPDMRELDDHVVQQARIVVDAREHAMAEAGDLIQPLKQGKITAAAIVADLTELMRQPTLGRLKKSDITIYKSAGFALQDALLLEALLEAHEKTS